MHDHKVSYIMTRNEISFLLNNIAETDAKWPARYILEKNLPEDTVSQDAEEGLIFKNLAKREDGKVILEPVISFIAKSILTAKTIWMSGEKGAHFCSMIISTDELALHIQEYNHIEDAWSILPYPRLEELNEDIDYKIWDDNTFKINEMGDKSNIKPDKNGLWLTEG